MSDPYVAGFGSSPRVVSDVQTRDYWLSCAAQAVAMAKASRGKKAMAMAQVAVACVKAAQITR